VVIVRPLTNPLNGFAFLDLFNLKAIYVFKLGASYSSEIAILNQLPFRGLGSSKDFLIGMELFGTYPWLQESLF
jgi:hypothetical protein